MKQRHSLGYFVIALTFTCTSAFTAVAQNPHAAYPTYVGKVSPHHPSHIHKARRITSLQPSGFNILADMVASLQY